MSEWNNIEDDDIDVELEDKEVNIYAGYNDFGSIYAVLTFEQIDKIYKEIHAEVE
jgi:hypothetical protein